MKRVVALACPCGQARFSRDKYVLHWQGPSEASLERKLRAVLARAGLQCSACQRSVRAFVTVWGDAAPPTGPDRRAN